MLTLLASFLLSAGAGPVPGIQLADEGTNQGQITRLNCVGTGTVACTRSGVTGTITVTGGGASPLTTKGDIYTYSTTDDRKPVGTDGQCLIADSTQATGLKWDTCAAPGSGISYAEAVAAVLGGF